MLPCLALEYYRDFWQDFDIFGMLSVLIKVLLVSVVGQYGIFVLMKYSLCMGWR